MKHTITIAIAAGTVAGFLAGSLSPLIFGPVETKAPALALVPSSRPAPETVQPSPSPERLDALRSQIDVLELRLAVLEAGASDRREPAEEGPGDPLAEAAEERALSELASALQKPGSQLPDTLKLGVEQAVQDIREAERLERDAQRAEALIDRTETQLASLVTALDLTPVQTDAMRDYITTYEEKRTQLREDARDSGDFNSIRESMRTLRDESRTSLALILDPTQLELYRETEDDRRGGGRGDRRRDGTD